MNTSRSRVLVLHQSDVTDPVSPGIVALKGFTDWLRLGGIEANVDIYHVADPPSCWARWVENEAASSDFIIAIVSKALFEISKLDDPKARTIYSVILAHDRKQLLPVFLNQEIDTSLLHPSLKGLDRYRVVMSMNEGKLEWVLDDSASVLFARLTKQSDAFAPEPVRNVFASSPEKCKYTYVKLIVHLIKLILCS